MSLKHCLFLLPILLLELILVAGLASPALRRWPRRAHHSTHS